MHYSAHYLLWIFRLFSDCFHIPRKIFHLKWGYAIVSAIDLIVNMQNVPPFSQFLVFFELEKSFLLKNA